MCSLPFSKTSVFAACVVLLARCRNADGSITLRQVFVLPANHFDFGTALDRDRETWNWERVFAQIPDSFLNPLGIADKVPPNTNLSDIVMGIGKMFLANVLTIMGHPFHVHNLLRTFPSTEKDSTQNIPRAWFTENEHRECVVRFPHAGFSVRWCIKHSGESENSTTVRIKQQVEPPICRCGHYVGSEVLKAQLPEGFRQSAPLVACPSCGLMQYTDNTIVHRSDPFTTAFCNEIGVVCLKDRHGNVTYCCLATEW